MNAPELLAKMLQAALNKAVSDIHVDPRKQLAIIRFRCQGFLEPYDTIPLHLHQSLVLHIKSLARLRSDVHVLPHDGRISHSGCDIRVSIMPVAGGENIVLRLLRKAAAPPSLEELGFSSQHLELLRQALRYTSGMICVAGPTGSGKTTTLYALLSQLPVATHSIVTLEDPIEYTIDAIRQIPIAPQLGFTFATGLRSVLRQDPDIIMVGEVRDTETALLAVQAALTGHLVLTTVHAATSEKVITRFQQLGLPQYLLLETVRLVIAQRLVRKYQDSSVIGRQVLCEIRTPDEEQFVLRSPSLRDHGIQLVEQEITTLVEVERVLL
jgi:type IV pilus assembly protein PilB